MRYPALLPGRAALMGAALALPAFGAAPPAHAPTAGYVVRAPDTSGVVEWMKNPPPQRMQSVVLQGDSKAVGVVLPTGIKSGDQVTGTAIVMPANGQSTAEASGVVELETPDGKRHNVKSGDLVTFVAASGGALALLTGDHKTAAQADCPLVKPGALPTQPPKTPVLVQDNRAVSLPIPSDGDAKNTLCRIGGQPAEVIAARPGEAIVVPHGIGQTPGPVSIEAACNGQTAKLQGWAVRSTLTAPPRMHVGEHGTAKLSVFFGEKPSGLANGGSMRALVTNYTPIIVNLGGQVTREYALDMAKLREDGSTEIDVPFTALHPGEFTIASTISSGDQETEDGCILRCQGCTSSWGSCKDDGRVTCLSFKKACGKKCGGHTGGPCGNWFCQCKPAKGKNCFCK